MLNSRLAKNESIKVSLENLMTFPFVAERVNAVNAELASFETIKRFRILPVEFTVESGELTPTMKVKRKIVGQRYAREIEELFRDGAAA